MALAGRVRGHAGLAALPLLAAVLATPAGALDRTHLAVVVNTRDALSVAIGEYYAARRRISFQNVIRVAFEPGVPNLPARDFDAVRADVQRQTRPGVQAYALTWAAPYRVDCMSITSAFAFGFDPAHCADGCKPTAASPLFNSAARLPHARHGVRPTMALAARSLEEARALIDRGVAADGSRPEGTAYLLSTSDGARNVRHVLYPLLAQAARERLAVKTLQQDALENARDVLFYFTGRIRVEGLSTLRFLPGAIADHLTSAGGMLTDSPQMSALAWLEAGATGSYGTVVEPCNLLQKFPHPAIVADRYLAGETLIEAYWKGVLMPGQGIFVGEPLAAPFARSEPRRDAAP
ncbi:MAG: TIGR03790 family protein [Burkholderiales bacterium]|nr:TIGR03790 family protein [Burkholderiales bacterium]